MTEILLGRLVVKVLQKDIKNVHLSVYPPDGEVRVSAPLRMEMDMIRAYVLSRLAWIKQQQAKIIGQERETPREFLNRESHYVRGRRYMLRIIEQDARPKVELGHKHMDLFVRPGADLVKKREVLESWYRSELQKVIQPLLTNWELAMGIQVKGVAVRKMKTLWGSCNPEVGRITLNLELAKKPVGCVEYILVHEMVHFFEQHHNDRFVGLMDKFLPDWRLLRQELNRLPIGHVNWGY